MLRPAALFHRALPAGRAMVRFGTKHVTRPTRPPRSLARPGADGATANDVLAAAHLDHDPTNNGLRNLRSLCQRYHLIHDRPHHLAQRRITYLLRRALGDSFFGPYGNR
jgi:hypothetical protein